MPESANPPLSDADLQALAARLNYAINVFPQPSRISIGSGEVVEVDGAWQWSVRYRGGNRATGAIRAAHLSWHSTEPYPPSASCFTKPQ